MNEPWISFDWFAVDLGWDSLSALKLPTMFYTGIKLPQEFAEGLYNIPYSIENQKYPNNLYADSHNHLAKKKKNCTYWLH